MFRSRVDRTGKQFDLNPLQCNFEQFALGTVDFERFSRLVEQAARFRDVACEDAGLCLEGIDGIEESRS